MDISFILPCYNVEKYVEDCINSILSQDFNGYEYEIICVDDCGTDNTSEILQKMCKDNPHIKLIVNDGNKGVSFSRNRGIENATGKWLWFVDPDDFITKDSAKNLLAIGNDIDCDLVKGRYYDLCKSDEVDIQNKIYFRSSQPITVEKNTGSLPLNQNGVEGSAVVWSGIYKRSVFTENRVTFNEEICRDEDSMLSWELEQYDLKVGITDGICYIYRYNPKSISNFIPSERIGKDYKSYKVHIGVYDSYYQEGKCVDVPKMHRLADRMAMIAFKLLWKMPDTDFARKEYLSIKNGSSILSRFPRRGKEKFIYSNIITFLTSNLIYKIARHIKG